MPPRVERVSRDVTAARRAIRDVEEDIVSSLANLGGGGEGGATAGAAAAAGGGTGGGAGGGAGSGAGAGGSAPPPPPRRRPPPEVIAAASAAARARVDAARSSLAKVEAALSEKLGRLQSNGLPDARPPTEVSVLAERRRAAARRALVVMREEGSDWVGPGAPTALGGANSATAGPTATAPGAASGAGARLSEAQVRGGQWGGGTSPPRPSPPLRADEVEGVVGEALRGVPGVSDLITSGTHISLVVGGALRATIWFLPGPKATAATAAATAPSGGATPGTAAAAKGAATATAPPSATLSPESVTITALREPYGRLAVTRHAVLRILTERANAACRAAWAAEATGAAALGRLLRWVAAHDGVLGGGAAGLGGAGSPDLHAYPVAYDAASGTFLPAVVLSTPGGGGGRLTRSCIPSHRGYPGHGGGGGGDSRAGGGTAVSLGATGDGSASRGSGGVSAGNGSGRPPPPAPPPPVGAPPSGAVGAKSARGRGGDGLVAPPSKRSRPSTGGGTGGRPGGGGKADG
ncbi:hypothetical protein MMPV_003513 [Pyropia vietnamensis]